MSAHPTVYTYLVKYFLYDLRIQFCLRKIPQLQVHLRGLHFAKANCRHFI